MSVDIAVINQRRKKKDKRGKKINSLSGKCVIYSQHESFTSGNISLGFFSNSKYEQTTINKVIKQLNEKITCGLIK